jgi:hypothetical protein
MTRSIWQETPVDVRSLVFESSLFCLERHDCAVRVLDRDHSGRKIDSHGEARFGSSSSVTTHRRRQRLCLQQRKRAGIEHAKQRGDCAYIGRKPSFTREQFNKVRAMLGQEAVGIAHVARETGLTRQTVYRIKGDPAGAEGGLGDVSTSTPAVSRKT